MANEVVENSGGIVLPVTQADVDTLKAQRELLRSFVSSQLREANFDDFKAKDFGEGDYGVIPGTKKKTLLKSGAEKLMRLFNLGARFKMVDREIDHHMNFAIYTYQCEIYHLRTGIVVASCEATVNSKEVKYKERSVWRKKVVNGKELKEQVKEETPIYDILNTLQKMAQKRSLVGAVILATGASEYFTQDIEPEEVVKETAQETKERDVSPEPEEKAPLCCGKEMMVSKYPNRETGNHDWYCVKCKTSKAMGAA